MDRPTQQIRRSSELLEQEGNMDISRILVDLRREDKELQQAIVSLERLATARARGNSPLLIKGVESPKRRGRPIGSKNKKIVPAANSFPVYDVREPLIGQIAPTQNPGSSRYLVPS